MTAAADRRIITINTAKSDGPYRARIRWMAEELKRLAPDIVACQEAFIAEDGSADSAASLAASLDMHCIRGLARFKERPLEGRPVLSWSGVALLARSPWRWHELIPLPDDSRDGERVALVGETEVGGRAVIACSLHLTHLRDAEDLRRAQLATVLEHPAWNRAGAVRLLCGDFNATADGPMLAELLAREEGLRVRDVWARSGATGPRGTLAPRPGGSDDASGRCIDLIMAVAGPCEPLPTFRDSRVVLDQPDPATSVYPSDHFGVMTTLMVGGPH